MGADDPLPFQFVRRTEIQKQGQWKVGSFEVVEGLGDLVVRDLLDGL